MSGMGGAARRHSQLQAGDCCQLVCDAAHVPVHGHLHQAVCFEPVLHRMHGAAESLHGLFSISGRHGTQAGLGENSGLATYRNLAVLSASGVVDDYGADARGDAQLVVARARHAQLQHAVQQPNPAPVPPADTP